MALEVADPPERWEALGFRVRDRLLSLGGIRISLGGGGGGHGITGWSIADVKATGDIDGLSTTEANPPSLNKPQVTHPNGAVGIDHVVIVTPDFERTRAALETADMPLKRIRDAGTFRQGFRRIGPTILELVEAKTAPPGPARFWGLVVVVSDLTALKDRLGEHLGTIKPAVQPGRQITTLKRSAALTPHVAFMDQEA